MNHTRSALLDTWEVSMTPTAVKTFAKFLLSLQKVGDHVYFQPQDHQVKHTTVSLSSVNTSRSAFAVFKIHERFFSSFSFNHHSSENSSSYCSRLLIKPLFSIFRNKLLLETVDRCVIQLFTPDDPDRLTIKIYYDTGIQRTHKLFVEICDSLQAVYSKIDRPNQLIASPQVIHDWTGSFHQKLEEVSFICSPQELLIKSYAEPTVTDDGTVHRSLTTELKIHVEDFDEYVIGLSSEVTFNLKEFKSALVFGESLSTPVHINFESNGSQPGFFEADFVLATLEENDSEVNENRTNSTSQAVPTLLTQNLTTSQITKTVSIPPKNSPISKPDNEMMKKDVRNQQEALFLPKSQGKGNPKKDSTSMMTTIMGDVDNGVDLIETSFIGIHQNPSEQTEEIVVMYDDYEYYCGDLGGSNIAILSPNHIRSDHSIDKSKNMLEDYNNGNISIQQIYDDDNCSRLEVEGEDDDEQLPPSPDTNTNPVFLFSHQNTCRNNKNGNDDRGEYEFMNKRGVHQMSSVENGYEEDHCIPNSCDESNQHDDDEHVMATPRINNKISKLEEQLKIERHIKQGAEQMLLLADHEKGQTIKKRDVESQIKATSERMQNIAKQIEYLKSSDALDISAAKQRIRRTSAAKSSNSAKKRTATSAPIYPSQVFARLDAEQLNPKLVKESLAYALTAIERIQEDQGLGLDAINHLSTIIQGVSKVEHLFPIDNIIGPVVFCCAGYNRDIRAASYRLLRYYAIHLNGLKRISDYHIDVFIIKSMSKDHRYDSEKEEAFKLARVFLEIPDAVHMMPQSIVRAIVAIAESGDEKYQGLCIETLCELSLKNIEIVAVSGGLKAIFNVLLEGPSHYADMVIMTIIYILDHESTRSYLRPSVEVEIIVSSFTDILTKSNGSEEGLSICIKAITILLKTWSGFLYFCMDDSRAITALLDGLLIPVEENQRRILTMFFEVFCLETPQWFFDQRKLDKPMKTVGNKTLSTMADIQTPGLTISMLNQYLALLLKVFMDAGLAQTLDRMIQESNSSSVIARATALLSGVQQLAQRLLPQSYSAKINALSSLFVSATDFQNENKRQTATGAMLQIDRLGSKVDSDFSSTKSNGTILPTQSIRVANMKSKFIGTIEDSTFKQLINDAEVFCTKEYTKWSWDTLLVLFHGPLKAPQKLDDAIRNFKYIRRLLTFFKPSSFQLTELRANHVNRRLINLGCTLIKLLMSNKEGIKMLEESKMFNELVEILSNIEKGMDTNSLVLSRDKLLSSLASGYFEFLNVILEYEEGLKLLEKCKMIDVLYRIVNTTTREDIVILLIQNFDYERVGHEKVLLYQAMNSTNLPIRKVAVQRIQSLVQSTNNQELKFYLIDLLVQKLTDPVYELVEQCLKTLEMLSYFPDLLEHISQHICFIHHLELGTETLLLRCLSKPKGVTYLESSRLVDEFFDIWAMDRMYHYVHDVDCILREQILFSGSGVSLAYDEVPVSHSNSNNHHESEKKPSLKHPLIPPHFFGEFAKTKRGAERILQSSHFTSWCKLLTKYSKMKSLNVETNEELRAVLWTLGHIARSEFAFEKLLEEQVITSILHIAQYSTTLSIKGTCFSIIGMISTNPIAVEFLNSFGWVGHVSTARGVCLPTISRSFLDIIPVPFKGSWPSKVSQMIFTRGKYGSEEIAILELMGNISNHILSNSSSKSLNKKKLESPHIFCRVDMYLEMLRLISFYHYRLSIRRYLIDLFDVEFTEEDVYKIWDLEGLAPQKPSKPSSNENRLKVHTQSGEANELKSPHGHQFIRQQYHSSSPANGASSHSNHSAFKRSSYKDEPVIPCNSVPTKVTRGFMISR